MIKPILSSCDFRNPKSAHAIYNNLRKPIAECKVQYFPNEKFTSEKMKNGKCESRISAFSFQRKNIYVADYVNSTPCFDLDIDVIYISDGKHIRYNETDSRYRI